MIRKKIALSRTCSVLGWLAMVGLAVACGDTLTGTGTSATGGGTDIDISLGNDADSLASEPDTAVDAILADSGDATATTDTGNSTACPGGPACTCSIDSDCDSGVCIETAAGKQCAQTCGDTSCPSGFACKPHGSVDSISICVPLHLSLCAPCLQNSDCQAQGANDAWCLDRGADGAFCGGTCAKDVDCPDGYVCGDGKPLGGGASVKACQPKAGAICTCSAWATKLGVATNCQNSNSFGACSGKRNCTAQGLTACDAPQAKAEMCNGQDDNCNGKVDDLAPGTGCMKKAFEAKGSAATCKLDSDCSSGEACDSGVCHVLIGACPGKATCTSSGEELCLDAKSPSYETCNGQDDDCDGMTDETFGWVDLATGGTVAIGQPCGAGACGGGFVQCQTINQAICSTISKAGKDICNGQDDDCDGQTDETACDDNDACTSDLCNAVAAACDHTAAVSCDDGNPCTADSCDKATAACDHTLTAGTSCSDGNACTVGDACGADPGGQPACLPGLAPPNCDDGNPCTDDSCDVKTGCVALANAASASCYDGPGGTVGVGTCLAGKKVCKDGLLGACVGAVVPATIEACDSLDDNCNGLTDEICKIEGWQGALVAVGGGVSGGTATGVELATSGTIFGDMLGQQASSVWAGFARWLFSW